MKKSILLFAFLALLAGGDAFAKTLKQIKIVNNSKTTGIYVSWGYNAEQLQSFIVYIGPSKTLKVAGWDVSRKTNVFVHDPEKAIADNKRGTYDYWYGFVYMMPLEKAIDLKYSADKGLRSNTMWLKDKDIITKCEDGDKFKMLPVSACAKPYYVKANALGGGTMFAIDPKPGEGYQGMKELQKFSNEMRDKVY